MEAMIKMLLPMLGLTPEKVKGIIDDLRLTANNYAADMQSVKNDLAEIKAEMAKDKDNG